ARTAAGTTRRPPTAPCPTATAAGTRCSTPDEPPAPGRTLATAGAGAHRFVSRARRRRGATSSRTRPAGRAAPPGGARGALAAFRPEPAADPSRTHTGAVP